jgi:hypothetical protein
MTLQRDRVLGGKISEDCPKLLQGHQIILWNEWLNLNWKKITREMPKGREAANDSSSIELIDTLHVEWE